ncbi:lactonase family protein [Microbacterium telephonicum]|uniref:6-phosphogluconolactonase (Cycloisomerase 2 family) n=1 Tax=Microbacterium telephonicum TaxID=1714841 RepID=A0A498CJ90_9MICO|nr:beta-propeller fold lactonase family protein [Microbacterium telephonicum]RLK52248.1 6-phosphogluconolactonase (cycloisomerase 2 family) [Microbacterium telephonicum]
MARLLIGGYGADMDGDATGAGLLRAGAADETLSGGALGFGGTAFAAASPSWLAWHPSLPIVYAALEGAGAVRAFRRVGEEAFEPVGAAVEVGAGICHVVAAPDGGFLIASCYGDGRVMRVALDAEGRLGAVTAGEASTDPYAGREPERAPHAHQARFVPGGVLVSSDLGHDQVRIWDTSRGGMRQRGVVALPFGSGPRHTVWHPSGHLYVVTEYSNEVFVLAPDRFGAWSLVAGTPVSPGTLVGVDYPGEICLSRDARFVVVGVRGSNTLASLRVGGTGAELYPVAMVESGVDWPRHQLVTYDTVLVAGQRSGSVASLTLDERTGAPGRVRHRVEVPTPTHLLPL